jgi:hypothetical protein
MKPLIVSLLMIAAACQSSGQPTESRDAGTSTGGIGGIGGSSHTTTGGIPGGGGTSSSGGVTNTGGVTSTGGIGGVGGTDGGTGGGGTAGGLSGGGGTTSSSGGTNKGGATATGGTGTATSTGGTGSCDLPACYQDLVSACVPTGTCVEQRVAMCGATACPQPLGTLPSSIVANQCYANGVTVVEVTDTASTNVVTTVKGNGKACYSYETQYSEESPTSLPIVLKNPAGTTVVTFVIDNTNSTASITCAGDSPVQVSLDCLPSSAAGATADCNTGTCTP